MKILVDIPEAQLKELSKICDKQKKKLSRAAVVREAIAAYIATHQSTSAAHAFGLWRDNIIDGLAYQQKQRAEW